MRRQIEVGAVLRRVFDIYVEQAPILMPAAATVWVFSGLLTFVLLSSSNTGLAVLGVFVSLLATSLFTAMIVELVADLQDGRRDRTARDLVRAVAPVIGQVLLVGMVAALGEVLGFVFFLIPGLVLITVWAVFVPVIVIERPPGLAALARSRELVAGSGWPVFGVIVVLDFIIALLVSGATYGAESGGFGAGLAVRVVLGVLTAPLPALGAAVLYFDLGGGSARSAAQSAPQSPPQSPPPSSGTSAPNPFGEE